MSRGGCLNVYIFLCCASRSLSAGMRGVALYASPANKDMHSQDDNVNDVCCVFACIMMSPCLCADTRRSILPTFTLFSLEHVGGKNAGEKVARDMK